MKGNSIALALLKKNLAEERSQFRKGNFDLMGFLLKMILSLSLATVFAIFFKKFSDIYLSVQVEGTLDRRARLLELFSAVFFALFVCFSIASASKLSRQFFGREDLKLFSALPIRGRSIYAAGMISSYLSLLPAAVLILVLFPLLFLKDFSAAEFVRYGSLVLLLPLLSLSFGALLSLPFHAIRRFFEKRYLLTFLVATLFAALGFYLYSKLLGGVKDLLLGDDFKYFFNEARMSVLGRVAKRLYPGVFFARYVLGKPLFSFLALLGLFVAGIVLSLLTVGVITSLMKANERVFSGRRGGKLFRRKSPFFALLFKERKEIFRNPSYAFSCFSTAATLPLMVYFCMSAGDSLVKRFVGIDCGAELALFLTLMFGSLSNVFCSTNISREGENFYALKAMPLKAWDVFGAKILFCLAVSAFSQMISASVLHVSGYISLSMAIFLFFCGTLFSFAQICFSTKYDFRRAKFSADEDGFASEASGTAAAVILLGMLSSFTVGGIALLLKLLSALKFQSGGNVLYESGGALVLLSGLCFFYLAHRLERQYRDFSGGGLI